MSELEKFAEMTDEELKKIALSCHAVVYVYQCYGRSDLYGMRRATQELTRRGYEVFTVPRLVIQKPEEEALAVPRPTQEASDTSDIVTLIRWLLESEDNEAKHLVLAFVSVLSREIMHSPRLG